MSTDTLETVQAALDEAGVRDVKFYFNSSVDEKPYSEVAHDISYLLTTYLRGDCTPLKPLGDEPSAKSS